MRFFSLFKSPQYQRFEYQPRYFDPEKEELKKRVARIKREGDKSLPYDSDHSSIRDAFSKRQTRNRSASLLQLIIFVILTGSIAGWLFYGNKVWYFFLLSAPVYLYFRFKKKRR